MNIVVFSLLHLPKVNYCAIYVHQLLLQYMILTFHHLTSKRHLSKVSVLSHLSVQLLTNSHHLSSICLSFLLEAIQVGFY